MPEPRKRDLKVSRSASSTKSGSNSKRKSLLREDPSTPTTLQSAQTDTPPSSGLKRLFNGSRRSSHDEHKSKPLFKTGSTASNGTKVKTIELPPIVSVKSKEKDTSDFSFQDQSSVHSYTNSGRDARSVDFEIPKSEVNSILNVPPSLPQLPYVLKPDVSNASSSSRGMSSSQTTDLNTTTADEHDNADSGEDSKAGLISSFFSAAANHINGMGNSEDHERSETDISKPEPKSSKLGNVFSSIKNFAGDPNLPLDYLAKSEPYGNHINKLVNQSSNPPRILLDGGPMESNLTKNVVFEPMKPSPVSTLGKGDLSLADFEADNHLTPDHVRRSEDFTGTTTIDRIMSPVGRRSSGGLEGRNRSSSSVIRASSSQTLPLIKYSDNGNGDSKKKKNPIKGSGSKGKRLTWSTFDDSDKQSTRTDTNEYDTVSPAISRVITNGHSQTRGRFKTANEKRQAEFHLLFKQVPQNEKLIEDYSCALQKEILVQGRLFISECNVCFNSNILGWVTNIAIPFSEIIQIEKKNTAGVFPNAIQVQTLHSKNIFASLLARESTFETMTSVWNQNLHGFNRDSLTSLEDFEDNADTEEEEEEDIGSDESDIDSYSSGEEDDDTEPLDEDLSGSPPTDQSIKGSDESTKPSANEEFNGIPFEGPRTHAATDNGYEKKSGETLITDEVVAAPVGVVYNLLFGDDPTFIKKCLEKSKNYDISDIPKLESVDGVKRREYSYVKPLSGPVGPKKTKCIINESVESCDFSTSVQVVQSSQSPDVPSGGSFTVKSTILLSWANNNSTRLVVLTSVEWTAKSWIKGAVEKGSIDGQKESMRVLLSELRARVAEQPSRKRSTTTGKRKPKKQLKKEEPLPKEEEPNDQHSENPLIQIIKMIGDMIPVPDYLKIPLFIISVILVIWFSPFFKRSKNTNQLSTFSNINIDGSDYILLPSSFTSNNYLSNKLEYDIWEWIDSRNGENSNVGAQLGAKRKQKSKRSADIDGHSRQSLEELVKLTQMKLDQMRRMLDQ